MPAKFEQRYRGRPVLARAVAIAGQQFGIPFVPPRRLQGIIALGPQSPAGLLRRRHKLPDHLLVVLQEPTVVLKRTEWNGHEQPSSSREHFDELGEDPLLQAERTFRRAIPSRQLVLSQPRC